MDESKNDLQAAQKSIASTIQKNEKVYETLSQKQNPRPGQLKMVAKHLDDFRMMLALVEKKLSENDVVLYSMDQLKNLQEAIPLYVDQIEKVKLKLKEGTPQFTLADRRIKAYDLVLQLLEKEMQRLRT